MLQHKILFPVFLLAVGFYQAWKLGDVFVLFCTRSVTATWIILTDQSLVGILKCGRLDRSFVHRFYRNPCRCTHGHYYIDCHVWDSRSQHDRSE